MSDSQKSVAFSRGDVIAKSFEVERELGAGLLGATYLVRNISSNKQLALKVLRADLFKSDADKKRFSAAFELAKAVRHEGLVRLGDSGEHDGSMFFTMDYFESKNLRQLIDEYQKEQRSFTLQEACQVAVKILEAVDHLHNKDIIHRNVKPENVLVHERRTGPGGRNIVRTIKLTDSGMADMVSPAMFAETFVNRQEARYLAPELSGFNQGGEPGSDVFSVGVVLYELLVGQPPRGSYLSPTQLRGDLPEHIDDVVEIALAANGEDRYPGARDMLNDIQRSFSGEVFEDKSGSNFRNVLVGVGVALLVILGVGIYVSVTDRPDVRENYAEKDDVLRKAVQGENRVLSESELNERLKAHPEMLFIPEGPFVMGRLNQEDLKTASQSEPVAKKTAMNAFYIDRFEFPNRLKDAEGAPVRPVARVGWVQADETCTKLGKRLCTELEWEKACKGPANWIYSYGDTYDPDMCGDGVDQVYTLGERENCVSGYGLYGMSGGLREWTASVAGSKNNRRVVKGGLRANNERGSRCAFAVDESIGYADNTLTFRCCLDAGAPAAPAEPTTPPAPTGTETPPADPE